MIPKAERNTWAARIFAPLASFNTIYPCILAKASVLIESGRSVDAQWTHGEYCYLYTSFSYLIVRHSNSVLDQIKGNFSMRMLQDMKVFLSSGLLLLLFGATHSGVQTQAMVNCTASNAVSQMQLDGSNSLCYFLVWLFCYPLDKFWKARTLGDGVPTIIVESLCNLVAARRLIYSWFEP